MPPGQKLTSEKLGAFIVDYAAGGHPVQRLVEAVCSCQGRTFTVEVDDSEGFAARTCLMCAVRTLMLDSADVEEDAEPEECECPCGHGLFAVTVGFSMRPDNSVKWVSLGLQCVACERSGVYADWKIDYDPTEQLLRNV